MIYISNRLGNSRVLFLIAIITGCLSLGSVANAEPVGKLKISSPEKAGMDSSRLDRLSREMKVLVDQGVVAGLVTIGARDNKIVHFNSVGYKNLETKSPMTKDSIFRIYSMSKPITGVALMILHDEGKFRLSDPVDMYIPEFTDMQVHTGLGADGKMLVEPAQHRMTIRELMNHTAGIAYGTMNSADLIDQKYSELNIFDPDSSLHDMVKKIAKVPLKYQPGSKWYYSASVDIQGYLVEKLSGQRFGDFLEQRVFKPLGMKDTAFYVPEDKVSRFAEQYNLEPDGTLVAGELFDGAIRYLDNQKLQAGGWGLVSTAMDYLRFSQMLLNGGELDGVRILAPLTVKLMHTNHLPKGFPLTDPLRPVGTSFGLNFAIVEDPVEGDGYSRGEYYWGGAAGTWFWIDPIENVVFVGMVQHFQPHVHRIRGLSQQLFYQAITEPK